VGARGDYHVTSLRHRLAAWRQDSLLGRVVRNSSYLFSSATLAAALSFAQGIFAVRLLGIEGYGLISGTVLVLVSNVNRLLSFRMSEVTVKYLSEAIQQKETQRAAAIIKGIGSLEAITSVLTYAVLLALLPWLVPLLTRDPATLPLFAVYGLVLLSNLVYETSTGVLQTFKRFDRIALANTIQSIITATLIFLAFFLRRGMWEVLAAYLLGKTAAAFLLTFWAVRQADSALGAGWWRVSLRHFPQWRAAFHFALNTNLNGTVTLLGRDAAPLFLAAFRSQAEVGYFKLALSLINLVMLPIEPFIWPTYAEIAHTVAQHQWQVTRRLLRRVSLLAGAWTVAAGGGLIALGWWLIPFVYGADAAPAYPAVILLLFGFGFANIFHWNRPLWLALGRPSVPLLVTALAALLQILLIFPLVPRFGYLGQAALLSAFFLLSVGLIVALGLRELSRRAFQESAS
jgi:O-antigen/teichoic acid export membrane protein